MLNLIRLVGIIVIYLLMIVSLALAKEGDLQKGKSIYEKHCIECHGKQGKGDGLLAVNLNPKPADMTKKETIAKLTDDDLFKIISKGGIALNKSPVMPAFASKINESSIWDVISYIRTLGEKK